MERRFERRSFAPIRVGEELDVKIEAVGAKGDGIAKVKGFVIFVASTKQGDTVRVKITKVFRKVGFGEVIGEAQGPVEESSNTSENQDEESYADEKSTED